MYTTVLYIRITEATIQKVKYSRQTGLLNDDKREVN